MRAELEKRAELLRELIDAADARDRAAELVTAPPRPARPRPQSALSGTETIFDETSRIEPEASIDRIWAGADRDAAAIDRASLRDTTLTDPAGDE